MPKKSLKIVVLGGIVMDLVFDVPEWPYIRKAVQAKTFVMQPGGKGLNQAIAAARLGAQVSVISAVGQDQLGDILLSKLDKEGIDSQFIDRSRAADTDATCVIVEKGEPGFIGAKLATTTVDARLVKKAENYIKGADAVMATGEVPINSVESAFEIARKYKVTTILNPAPPERIPSSLLSLTDFIVPNAWEASIVADEMQGGYISADAIAWKLRQEEAKNVIITTGDVGCLALIGDQVKQFQGFKVAVIDTTGASDAFCAALAVSLAEEKDVSDAITIACASGALSCTKFGAATSMPTRSALKDFLRRSSQSVHLD